MWFEICRSNSCAHKIHRIFWRLLFVRPPEWIKWIKWSAGVPNWTNQSMLTGEAIVPSTEHQKEKMCFSGWMCACVSAKGEQLTLSIWDTTSHWVEAVRLYWAQIKSLWNWHIFWKSENFETANQSVARPHFNMRICTLIINTNADCKYIRVANRLNGNAVCRKRSSFVENWKFCFWAKRIYAISCKFLHLSHSTNDERKKKKTKIILQIEFFGALTSIMQFQSIWICRGRFALNQIC